MCTSCVLDVSCIYTYYIMYAHSHHKPIEEIESMLLDLPLRPEIYKDLIELIGALFVQVEDMELSEVPREFLVQVEEEIQVIM